MTLFNYAPLTPHGAQEPALDVADVRESAHELYRAHEALRWLTEGNLPRGMNRGNFIRAMRALEAVEADIQELLSMTERP